MAISSSSFGPVTLTSDEAKVFNKVLRLECGTEAAAEAAANGRRMVAEFERDGQVTVELRLRASRLTSETEE
jgi:hypothetical protein